MDVNQNSVHIFREKLWPPPRASISHPLHQNNFKQKQVNYKVEHDGLVNRVSDIKENLNDSLLCHIKTSKDVIKKCSQLYDLSKNDIELRKVKESKQLEKEIEKDKEKYRRALLVQQQASNQENRASITIQRFYTSIVLKNKTRGMNISKNLNKTKCETLSEKAIIIQKSYRLFSVRIHFKRSCTILISNESYIKKLLSTVAISRAEYEYQNHRIYQRKKKVHHCQKLIELLNKKYDTQVNWIVHCYNKDETKLKELQTRAIGLSKALQNKSDLLSLLNSSSDDKHAELLLQFRKIKVKQRHNDSLCDMYKKSSFLLLKHSRHICRLVTKSKVLSQYTHDYFVKIRKDWETLNMVLALITKRLDLHSDSINNNNYVCYEWLNDQKLIISDLLINYDTDQETTLEREVKRLDREIDLVLSAKDAMVEIFYWIHAEISYESENIGSELAYIAANEGCDKGLEISERMESICEKLKILRGSVYPQYDGEVDSIHDAIEKDVEKSPVDIISDCNMAQMDQSHQMHGFIRNIKRNHQAIKTEDWLVIFWSQPWLRLQHLQISRQKAYLERERREVDSKIQCVEKNQKKLDDDKKQADIAKYKAEKFTADAKSPEMTEFRKKEIMQVVEKIMKPYHQFMKSKYLREDNLTKLSDKFQEDYNSLKKEGTKISILQDEQKELLEYFSNSETRLGESQMKEIMKKLNELDGRKRVFTERADLDTDAQNKNILEIRRNDVIFEKRRNDIVNAKQKIDEMKILRVELIQKATLDVKSDTTIEKLKTIQQDIRMRKDRIKKGLSYMDDMNTESNIANNYEIHWNNHLEIPSMQLKQIESELRTKYLDAENKYINIKNIMLSGVKQIVTGKSQQDEIETLIMKKIIKKRMTAQRRKCQALSHLQFTVGKDATEAFRKTNINLKVEGKQFFRPLTHEIGEQDQVVLWLQMTTNQNDFITNIEFSHTNISSKLYKSWKAYGYTAISHIHVPSACIWYLKDKDVTSAIIDLEISYSKEDEKELYDQKYEKIDINLSHFSGLCDCYIWIQYAERASVPKLNKNYEKQSIFHCAVELEQDAVDYTKEFLALTSTELGQFFDIYLDVDKDKDGYISVKEFGAYISESSSISMGQSFTRHVLNLSGAPQDIDKLDFGMTIKAIATFGMLSSEEICKFTFSMYGDIGLGSIHTNDFLNLLKMLHPASQRQQRGIITRALREFDLHDETLITYSFFKEINSRFPHLMYPAFMKQKQMREKFMGVTWWERKLRKFKQVKDMIKNEEADAEAVVERLLASESSSVFQTSSGLEIENKSNAQHKTTSKIRNLIESKRNPNGQGAICDMVADKLKKAHDFVKNVERGAIGDIVVERFHKTQTFVKNVDRSTLVLK